MKNVNLYNQDGSLHPEAQFLLSPKPDDMSMSAWRKMLKDFRNQLSLEDIKKFKKLRKKKLQSEYHISKQRDAKRKEQELIANIKKINLYNRDGSLSPEAQFLLSPKPDEMSIAERRKRVKVLKSLLSAEDLKEFERLRKIKQSAKWRAGNPEKVTAQKAKWRVENPEKVKQDNARWKAENPDYHANWYVENTEKAKQDHARWKAENPEKIRAQQAKRRTEDPFYRLRCNMRNACTRVVKQLSLGKKPMSTFKWIGCSPEELKAHLESLFTKGMTWQNYGEWHVDHIRPICSFTAEEWEQVNHYTNLRPLWAEDNITKSAFDKLQKVKKETPILKESPLDVMN